MSALKILFEFKVKPNYPQNNFHITTDYLDLTNVHVPNLHVKSNGAFKINLANGLPNTHSYTHLLSCL